MYTGLSGPLLSIESLGGNIAAGVVPAALASSATAAAGGVASSASILGMSLGVAVPVIGAAIAGVTAMIGIWISNNAKYHAQETATTHIVDEAEKFMQQNLDAWNQSQKTKSEQEQGIANYNAIWAQVVQACNQQQYGDPGQRCIHDRERGGKWPWPTYFLDPIANDPNVQPDPVQGAVSGIENALSGGVAGIPLPLLLIAGLMLVAVAE
jgi:hypothetical protein